MHGAKLNAFRVMTFYNTVVAIFTLQTYILCILVILKTFSYSYKSFFFLCFFIEPKHLPIPNDFKIDILPKLLANNSVYTKLSWKLQDSDYPIETIEFSWSRFIQEGNGSLLMEKILLPEVSYANLL